MYEIHKNNISLRSVNQSSLWVIPGVILQKLSDYDTGAENSPEKMDTL